LLILKIIDSIIRNFQGITFARHVIGIVISVICVYNNKTTLEGYLLKSLRAQSVAFELILVDNINGKFKSASEALNFGARNANGKYLMFVHQDINLCSQAWLEDAERLLDTISNLGIAGVAGKRDSKGVMTVIKHGTPPVYAGKIKITKPIQVQTLDECLLIIPRQLFSQLKFDENACSDWHLHAVDYCLSVAKLRLGIFVVPMFVYHYSRGTATRNPLKVVMSLGSFPVGYYETLKRLLVKHRNSYSRIYTTCGDWDTSFPLPLQRFGHMITEELRLLSNIVLRKLGKSA